LDPLPIDLISRRSFGFADDLAIPGARKRARIAIILLCVMYLGSLAVFAEDVLVVLAVFVAGASTLLESAHGALAFDRMTRRLF
jgi:hypothetical protein